MFVIANGEGAPQSLAILLRGVERGEKRGKVWRVEGRERKKNRKKEQRARERKIKSNRGRERKKRKE